jgi:hypothetical protein
VILDGKGRFVLHDKPAAYPFTDIVTTTGEGPVFDLSVDLEFYSGVAYVKAEHVEEMAHTLGMVTKVEADELRAKIIKLEEEKNTLPVHVERLIHGINASLVSYADSHSSVPITVPVYLQDIDPGTEDGKGNEPEPDSADSIKSVTIGSDKPSGKDGVIAVGKGSPKLSGSTGDGFNF